MYGSDPLYKWAKARQEEWWAEAERRRLVGRSKQSAKDQSGEAGVKAEVIALPSPAPAGCEQTPGAA
ncbi:MAG TPA: hypothetical protein VID03_05855 [Acidimicrobiia bacterium]|jgi:hypothetical protein